MLCLQKLKMKAFIAITIEICLTEALGSYFFNKILQPMYVKSTFQSLLLRKLQIGINNKLI